jgi:hypothetical protein
MSWHPCCCEGIVTPCCASHRIPETLYLTVNASGTAGDLDTHFAGVYPLTWNAGGSQWEYFGATPSCFSATFGENLYWPNFAFRCNTTPNPDVWQLAANLGGGVYAGDLQCYVVTSPVTVTFDCATASGSGTLSVNSPGLLGGFHADCCGTAGSHSFTFAISP